MSKYDVKIEQGQGLIVGDDATLYHVDNLNVYLPSPELESTIPREELLKALRTANAELRVYPHEIAGVHLERPEVDEILEWVLHAAEGESLGMVLDHPGGGKTVILRCVLMRLEVADVPVLSIKADTLSGIKNSTDLAARLDLPLSVVELARAVAREGLLVVLMDQLDALSMNLSRDQPTLDVMLSTLAALRTIKNVRVVSSCRTFNLKHDPRLSATKPDKTFKLVPLTQDQVGTVLELLKINTARLLPSHRMLLTTPLHLNLYARIISEGVSNVAESFATLQELYEALWQRHIATTPPGASSSGECVAAIYLLVDTMQNNPQLTAPLAVLDGHTNAAVYLQRIGFIRRERNNFLFSHQTLFDYCYARRFVASGRSISETIFAGHQGLFERSQMVQVLAYLRGGDATSYRNELIQLFFSDKLRAHLRLLLMDWFGALRALTDEEKDIARRLLSVPTDHAQFLLSASSNEDWFDRLLASELLKLFQREKESIPDAVFWYLGSMLEERASEVVALLRPHVGTSADWNRRIVFSLARQAEWKSDEAIELLCQLLQVPTLQQGQGSDAIMCLYSLAKSNPAGLCRALRALLEQRVLDLSNQATIGEDGEPSTSDGNLSPSFALSRRSWNEYLFGEDGIGEMLEQAVKVTPEAVVNHLLPWYVQTCEKVTGEAEADSYPGDWVFSTGWYDAYLTEASVFSRRITEALQEIARTDTEKFRVIARSLTAVESLAVQRVLVNAYLANPEMYRDDIVEYFVTDKRRLAIGDRGARTYDSERLYGAVFSFANAGQRNALESLVITYQPHWETHGHQFRGLTQLHFLKSVPSELLSAEAFRRLGELERRFPDYEPTKPHGVIFDWVGPPIEKSAITKMSDDQWLSAMRKYNDNFRRTSALNPFRGGVSELAGVLTGEAKDDPERFYRLSFRFDDSISFKYVQALISALSESPEAHATWLFDVIRRFSGRIQQDDRRGICWALNKRSHDSVPDDLLDLLSTWALHDPDPLKDDWDSTDSYGNKFHQGDPYNQGINTNRGASIESVCLCSLQQKHPQTNRALNLLEQAAADQSTAVRSCIVEGLVWTLHRGEDERTLNIFDRVMNGHPRLLQLSVTHRFLHSSYREHFPRVRPFIEKMLEDTTDENTRQNGAAMACLAAFEFEEAKDLEERAMNGDHIMRRGAAQVYARQLTDQKLQHVCRDKLLLLMSDTDEDVRASVGSCFQFLEYKDFAALKEFTQEYIASPSLPVSSRQLVKYAKTIAADEHLLALEIAERILNSGSFRNLTMNKRGATLADEGDLTTLVLTAYTHATDAPTKARAMEVFERLLLAGSYAARTALQDWDRR
jgi:hypothetical protein